MVIGKAIVIPPLQTIQLQMSSICEDWEIPYLNISEVRNPAEITTKLQELQPKVIIASIEDIANSSVQSQLQALKISYVALDECQVPILEFLAKKNHEQYHPVLNLCYLTSNSLA